MDNITPSRSLCVGRNILSLLENKKVKTSFCEFDILLSSFLSNFRSESALADNKCNKLAILSLRCQSLLYLRLYKLRKAELRECQSKLEDLLNQATKNGLLMSPGGSPTPSPAGSEESGYSKSSGYTSSGELPITPAASSGSGGSTLSERNMSVPHILMHQQYHYSYYLTQCHELWEMADLFTTKGQCQGT